MLTSIIVGLYVLALVFIFLYSLAQGHLLWHYLKKRRSLAVTPQVPPLHWPKVTVQLPIYNEKYVADRLLEAVSLLNYPEDRLEIQVLDDSDDETSDILAKKITSLSHLSIQHVRRENRDGYKAGALKHGLSLAKGDLIAVFDADFVPDPEFLLCTVPEFSNPKVGMVQTRWTHLNLKQSLLTRLQAFALDAHFIVEQVGRNTLGAFINFNGTGGIWRKQCIIDAGDWSDDTLTEDLDLSYRAQKAGWEFIYLPNVASPAELPPIMSALKSQQFRWTKGGAECAKKHLLSMWLRKDLPLMAKLHATAHLLNSTIFIAILMVSALSVPLWWMSLYGHFPEWLWKYGIVFMLGFFIIAGVYFVANTFELKGVGQKLSTFFYQLPLFLAVSMGMALHNSIAVWEGFTGQKSPFIRTPKFNAQSLLEIKKNRYLTLEIPLSTYAEGGFALVFLVLVGVSIWLGHWLFFPLHLLLCIGYFLVFIQSFHNTLD
ncbi:glycosyltransferase [Pleomorphovibrio marinus]|uniref:glycosyltransferase n=1 Tax=Pleomorphovibrio marinus TaxID=2164132 RepID=UPI0018E536F9|nr:glycosyltransferase [Pleomorphovibrio marinus]